MRAKKEKSDRILMAYDEFGYSPYEAEKYRPLVEFLYHRWFRVKVSGGHVIPSKGPFIVVANHAGVIPFDGLMIKHAIEELRPGTAPIRPLIENHIFYTPYIGLMFQRLGCVRADPRNAEKLLRGGSGIVVFPEGIKGISKPYRERYNLQRFGRGGLVKLAIKTKSPIIPAGVIGSEETYPLLKSFRASTKIWPLSFIPITPLFPLLGPLGVIPLPSRWTIEFGEKIDVSQVPPERADDDILVNELNEKLRSRIQNIVYRLLRERKTVWFG